MPSDAPVVGVAKWLARSGIISRLSRRSFSAVQDIKIRADLGKYTFNLVTYNEVRINGRFEWVFGKKQCMHCQEPACGLGLPGESLGEDS